jgi:hypothetical protein
MIGFSLFVRTEGGNRTRTRFKANRILSPACLPVPPLQQLIVFKIKSPPGREGI